MNKNNTLLLFGRSMFIDKIREQIPFLIDKYSSMGVNSFTNSFRTEYVIFYDDFCPNLDENQTLVTDIRHFQNPRSKCYETVRKHLKRELFMINNRFQDFSKTENILNFFFHTPSMAINWAYLKGFKNVVLAGIDLSKDTRHFDNINFNPCWTNEKRLRAREHLEKVCAKYLNVLQLNPDSDLDLKKITVKELLNG